MRRVENGIDGNGKITNQS